jgi:SsrA-binding protein
MAAHTKDGIQVITEHRRAKFDFEVEETLEAGLELMGSEVKALRNGEANLSDAYGSAEGPQMFLCNAHIGAYKPAAMFAHLPTRKRRLLLHRQEIDKWSMKVRERGYSIIPLMLYFKNGRAKVRLGLGRGRKKEDRRHTIKERESKREMDRAKGFDSGRRD